ncbi:hypothetical protein M5D96_004184 [Drosophila gunungcola]|uniref:Uncharacterized protein n=1 Tax=Drosophila gunungcola TaxID=103775 RepID=A0A9Q0BST3_9MUSC|nr:hypothetical protein M5D96_004184 [Drosophila gunungcola]
MLLLLVLLLPLQSLQRRLHFPWPRISRFCSAFAAHSAKLQDVARIAREKISIADFIAKDYDETAWKKKMDIN